MQDTGGHLIDRVAPGSPADKAGVRPGWRLLKIDNRTVSDIIDYKIMEADDQLSLLLETADGSLRRLRIKKEAGTPLGLGFEPPTLSGLQRCRNRCIFCFVDQNPPGMRPSLYLKDDDYRLSFIYGNFITLNRLTGRDLQRIIKLQLSPLYVSVHSTNPELRRVMFGSKNANRGLLNLIQLVKAGIKIHAQVVLCPGYNTGREMMRTIKDLYRLGPNILSVALVPVGLTGHRTGLPPLRRFTPGEAINLLEKTEEMQELFLKRRGSRFVFAADEFYLLAGRPPPGEQAYEGYPQLENGVGLVRIFWDELESIDTGVLSGLPGKLKITMVTCRAVQPLLERLAGRLNAFTNIEANTVVAENRFFGEEVTTAGLLTGGDLLGALEGIEPGDVVFIPHTLLKDRSNLFLDGMSTAELEQKLGVPIYAASGPGELVEKIREHTACPGRLDGRSLES